jgi:hypothetical protein
MPLDATCLTQALAGSAMLARRRIATTIQLGVSKSADGTDGMIAHAWLRCGDELLTGADGHERFTPVAALDLRWSASLTETVERRLPIERRRPAALKGLALQRELKTGLQALAADGVSDVVVLKGIPLAIRVFGSVSKREMRDIDLLVHQRDASNALATLSRLGYEPYAGLPIDLKRRHALTLQRPTSWGHMYVDLHWTAFHLGYGRVSEELQWRHTEPFVHQGLRCRVFDPTMTILHLAHHYVAHLTPKVLRDFSAAWNLWHDQVDQAEVIRLARRTAQLDLLAVAFARARQADLLDVDAPQIRSPRAGLVLRLLGGRLGRSEHGRMMVSLTAIRPGGSVLCAARAAFPSVVEMRVIYGDGSAAQVASRYLARPFELAAKAAKAAV